MRRATKVGVAAAWSCALHCAGGRPPAEDALSAMHYACEALAVAVTTGTTVPVDQVVAKACHVERIAAEMRRVVADSELPELVESWPGADAGARP